MLLLAAFLAIVAEGVLMNFLRKSSKNREIVKALIFMTLLITLVICVNIDDSARFSALRDSNVAPWIACALLLILIFLDMIIPDNPVSLIMRSWNKTTSNLFFVMIILTIIVYSVSNWTRL
jgi:hypothetical protein